MNLFAIIFLVQEKLFWQTRPHFVFVVSGCYVLDTELFTHAFSPCAASRSNGSSVAKLLTSTTKASLVVQEMRGFRKKTQLSSCCLLLIKLARSSLKFKIQSCFSHLVLWHLFISKGGENRNEYMCAYIYTDIYIYTSKKVKHWFSSIYLFLCFYSVSFSYFGSSPQSELEYKSLFLEGT